MEVYFSYLDHAKYTGSSGALVGMGRGGPLESHDYKRRLCFASLGEETLEPTGSFWFPLQH